MRVIEGDNWSLDYRAHMGPGVGHSLFAEKIHPMWASAFQDLQLSLEPILNMFHISCHVVRPVDSEASLAQLNDLHMKPSQVTIDELLKQPWFLNEWQAARDKLGSLSFQSARLLCTWVA